MNNPNDGGPAFPIHCEHLQRIVDQKGETVATAARSMGHHPGMTLRDYFAAAALHAMDYAWFESSYRDSEMATEAYWIADAMLAARDRKESA